MLAVAAAPGWIALAIIAALVVGGLWVADAAAARRDAANAQLELDDARQVVDRRAAAVAAAQDQAAELAGQAVAARQRLATNLAAVVATQPG